MNTETTIVLRRYSTNDRDACLELFDANCPDYFAANERVDYQEFLNTRGADYQIVEIGGALRGGYAVVLEWPGRARLNWIIVSRAAQGLGVGRAIMAAALKQARTLDAVVFQIAASHLSAPFFARFGARELRRQSNGWGPGMHRIDMEIDLQTRADVGT